MHLLFLDESGKLDQGGLFALGGVVVRDAEWHELRDLWQERSTNAPYHEHWHGEASKCSRASGYVAAQ